MPIQNDVITSIHILKLMDDAKFEQAALDIIKISQRRSAQGTQTNETNRQELFSESDQLAKVAEFLFEASTDPFRQNIRERFNANDKLLEQFDRSMSEIGNEVAWFVEFFIKADKITDKNRTFAMPRHPEADPNSALKRLLSQHEEDKIVDYLIHQVHLDIDAYLNSFYFINHGVVSQLTGRKIKDGFYHSYVSLCQELCGVEKRIERIKGTQKKIMNILEENEKYPRPSPCRQLQDQHVRSEIFRLLPNK